MILVHVGCAPSPGLLPSTMSISRELDSSLSLSHQIALMSLRSEIDYLTFMVAVLALL